MGENASERLLKERKNLKVIRAAAILAGLLMLVLSLAADRLGLGGSAGFGYSQIVLAAMGSVILLIGLVMPVGFMQRWAWQFARSKTMLVVGGLLSGLLLMELSLRVWEVQRAERIGNEFRGLLSPIPDKRLGVRLAPYAGGHDANGFRNDAVPDQVDIVAIGDSQTWGINASRSEAWPQTLARISGRRVYNMALGYYGPVQYLALTDDALRLSPKVIVVGLYFGNDLYGAYQMVYTEEMYAHFRSAKVSGDLLIDTIGPQADKLSKEEMAYSNVRPASTSDYTWEDWFVTNFAVLRFFQAHRRLSADDSFRRAKAWATAHPDHGEVYENGSVRTVFTPAYRLLALDLDEPRIAEGLRITKEILVKMQAKVEGAGAQLIVLLIPTKEMVYADVMERGGLSKSKTFQRLVKMETRARADIVRTCNQRGILYIDALPTLKKAVSRGEQIYPATTDGHPNPRGYFFLASVVHDKLVEMGFPSNRP